MFFTEKDRMKALVDRRNLSKFIFLNLRNRCQLLNGELDADVHHSGFDIFTQFNVFIGWSGQDRYPELSMVPLFSMVIFLKIKRNKIAKNGKKAAEHRFAV